MVTQEKWFLRVIYLQNFESYKIICKYYEKTGKYKEIFKKNTYRDKISGVYVNVGEEIVGLYSSYDGPVFFRNEEKFILKDINYRIKVIDKTEKIKEFSLIIGEQKKISIEYYKQKYINYDPWSEEDDVDFFLWLEKKQKEKDFYDKYTKNRI